MIAPRFPQNEQERIAALHELLILDTPPEDRFDLITIYSQRHFSVKTVLISLVDENRQWFKSQCGLDATETPRDISFCGHAILGDGILEIPDASKDPRFSDNPLVVEAPFIRFYAGAPLKLSSGYTVGTLCLIDPNPKKLYPEDKEHLHTLAMTVVQELEKK